MNITELLRDEDRRRFAAQQEADALREVDSLQEAQLLDVQVDALRSRACLLFDCRGALQIEMGNTAVLVVIETKDGRIIGIEVKAASIVSARDVRWPAQMRDRLGDRFVAGFVLHTGPTTAPFGDRLVALPISALWS